LLEITEADVHAIAENTAVAALACSSKGFMLKDLVATHHDLVEPIRAGIQKFDVDVEDLVYSCPRVEPLIWASLGTLPEHPRDDFARSESTNNDMGKLSISSVVSQGYYAAHQEIDSLLANLDSSFTVSDWVLDKFGPRSREAAIFFTHCLLACVNGDSRYFMKFLNRGVPVTFMHFQMRFRLEQEVPDQLWKVIEYQSFYATYEHYINRSQSSSKALTSDKQEISDRQTKRPRRQATQAVKTYAISLQSTGPSGIAYMNLDDDPSEYDSAHESSTGAVDAMYDCGANDLRRADQLALWIKSLADILHEEARKLRVKKKSVERDERGKPSQRIAKTPAHIELLKRLPPLRRLEAKLRGSVIATVDPDLEESEGFDDVKDGDWEDPRRKRKRRSDLYF